MRFSKFLFNCHVILFLIFFNFLIVHAEWFKKLYSIKCWKNNKNDLLVIVLGVCTIVTMIQCDFVLHSSKYIYKLQPHSVSLRNCVNQKSIEISPNVYHIAYKVYPCWKTNHPYIEKVKNRMFNKLLKYECTSIMAASTNYHEKEEGST